LDVGAYELRCLRHDTVDLRALKSWRDGQLNIAHGTKTEKYGKTKNKKQVAHKKLSGHGLDAVSIRRLPSILLEPHVRGFNATTGYHLYSGSTAAHLS